MPVYPEELLSGRQSPWPTEMGVSFCMCPTFSLSSLPSACLSSAEDTLPHPICVGNCLLLPSLSAWMPFRNSGKSPPLQLDRMPCCALLCLSHQSTAHFRAHLCPTRPQTSQRQSSICLARYHKPRSCKYLLGKLLQPFLYTMV